MRLNWKKAGLVVMDIVLGAYLIMLSPRSKIGRAHV